MKRQLLLFIIMFTLYSYSVCAREIVVSSQTTSKEMHLKLAKLQAGDTLLFKAGCYKVNLKLTNKHGSPDCPIVIKGEYRTLTIVDGGALAPNSFPDNCAFYIDDCSWVTIDNLSFRNCWVDAIRVNNSSYISLTNSTIEGSRRAIFAQGRKSHHFLIENCYWEQGEHVWTKENQYSWEELHHGKFRHYNGGLLQARMIGGSFVLRDNYIKNVYNGFRLSIMGDAESDTLACTNGEIYRNVIENSADNAFEPEVYCKNLHFYHNKMINSHAFISITEVGGGPLYFYGNTGVKLPDCKDGWTIFKFVGKERRMHRPLYVFNNSWQVDTDVLGRIQENYWNGDNIYHFNNAYHLSHKDSVGIYYLGTNNVFENDCANIPFSSLVKRTAKYPSIVADPLFLDGKNGNFRLQKESPCRDRGIVPDGINIGFTGDKLDIGAYDDDVLVEGPPFRYEDPGKEMPDQEMPRIVRHKVDKDLLKLWFSYPLNPSTIKIKNFMLKTNKVSYSFCDYILQDDGYLLVLKAAEELPFENISLMISQKPKGMNGQEMTFWASTIPTTILNKSQEALQVTKRIADNLIAQTSFDFEPKIVTYNVNVARLVIDQVTLDAANKVAYGLISINSESEKDAILGFSFQGDVQVFLNNVSLYQGSSDEEVFKEYTYNRFEFAHQVKVHLRQGQNQLLVKCGGGAIETLFSCCILKADGLFDPEVLLKNEISNSYINNWKVTTPFVLNTGNAMESIFEPERELKEYYQYNGKLISWQLQNPLLQQVFTQPAHLTNKKGFNADWHYANSNTLLGVLNLYKASNDYTYKRFVEAYNKNIIDNYNYFKEQYFTKRILRGAYFRLFRATMLDDTGGAVLPFAEMATLDRPQGLQLEILNQTLDYVLNKQSRLADGTFCRPEPIEHTVWADDLFMSVTFLLRMAEINKDPKLYDEIAFQIIQFNKYLTDSKTGLYRHGWYDETKELAPAAWARANGWMVWATSEALVAMPGSHKDYRKIKELFIKHLKAALSYQSESGLWHQIITCPDSYLETSGTAMFAIGLSRAIKKRWISTNYIPQLLKAWEAVQSRVASDGVVNGICRGTDMGRDVDYYIHQKPLDSDPRGLGAVLTLGAEMCDYFRCSDSK